MAEEDKVKDAKEAERDANQNFVDSSNKNAEFHSEVELEIKNLEAKLQRAEAEVLRGREELDAMKADPSTQSETRGKVDQSEVQAVLEKACTRRFQLQ